MGGAGSCPNLSDISPLSIPEPTDLNFRDNAVRAIKWRP